MFGMKPKPITRTKEEIFQNRHLGRFSTELFNCYRLISIGIDFDRLTHSLIAHVRCFCACLLLPACQLRGCKQSHLNNTPETIYNVLHSEIDQKSSFQNVQASGDSAWWGLQPSMIYYIFPDRKGRKKKNIIQLGLKVLFSLCFFSFTGLAKYPCCQIYFI